MRFTIALLALAALAGCTAKYDLAGAEWTRPGMMHQQVTLDEIDCAREAREAGYTPDLFVGGVVDIARVFIEDRQRYGTYERCMTSRGYARGSKA